MGGKMKAIVKSTRGYGAELREVDIPTIEEDEVLIKIKATSICGTDVHIYTWDDWASGRVNPPYVFGHEFSGNIVQVGKKVTYLKEGDYVSAETHIVCETCPQCLSGNQHICKNTKIIGVDTNGCFAEYIALPAKNIWKNPSDMPITVASIQEPLGNAVHTVLAGDVTGKTVAVIGCGPIGLMAIAVAKASGAASVFAIDVNPYRLGLAKKMGATTLINSKEEDPTKLVLDATDQNGVDVVCEMSGHPVAMNQGFDMITNGGRMSILSLPTKEVSIDVTNNIVFKGITVQGITGRKMFTTWQQVSSLLNSGALDVSEVITHVLPFSEYEKGFQMMIDGTCGKVVLVHE